MEVVQVAPHGMVAPVSGKIMTTFRAAWSNSPLTRVFLLCVLLTVAMIGLGFIVTHVLVYRWPLTLDDQAVRALVANRTPALNRISNDVSLVAYTTGLGIAIVVAGCAMRLAYRSWSGLLLLGAGILAEVEVFAITARVVGRARPPVPKLDDFPAMQSFPSGHVAAAIVVYGGIAMMLGMHARRTAHAVAWWVLLLLVPAVVAVSRVYRGMHHPSDVIASCLVGFGCLFILRHAMLLPAMPAVRPAS